jgi:hypothetical protein
MLKVVLMLDLLILLLIVQLLFSFFGQLTFPRVPHSEGFIYTLSLLLFLMITMKFLPFIFPLL